MGGGGAIRFPGAGGARVGGFRGATGLIFEGSCTSETGFTTSRVGYLTFTTSRMGYLTSTGTSRILGVIIYSIFFNG